MKYYIIFTIIGFLFGSILFSKIIPQLKTGQNICEMGKDHNPGAANVFMNCGIKMGALCLFLDMLKGFLPVFTASLLLDSDNLLFSIVIFAPVLGHALGIFNGFHGGKCISTSFGVVLGLMPISFIGFLLAVIYVLFVIIRIKPNRLLSILSFSAFAISSTVILLIAEKYSVAIGCSVFSLIGIIKHIPYFETLGLKRE